MKDFHINKQIDLKKMKQWKKAAKAVAENSKIVNKEFQKFSRLKRLRSSLIK